MKSVSVISKQFNEETQKAISAIADESNPNTGKTETVFDFPNGTTANRFIRQIKRLQKARLEITKRE
jgi:hypothetical protein